MHLELFKATIKKGIVVDIESAHLNQYASTYFKDSILDYVKYLVLLIDTDENHNHKLQVAAAQIYYDLHSKLFKLDV